MQTFDFLNLQLTKAEDNGFHFNSQNLIMRIPESRLDSDNFELGLAHELTEVTLRELILPLVNAISLDDFFQTKYLMHEVTILSLERYDIIADSWDILESDYEKAFQENLNKMPASQKKVSPSLETEKNFKSKKSKKMSIAQRITL
jgi:hypothetical protein